MNWGAIPDGSIKSQAAGLLENATETKIKEDYSSIYSNMSTLLKYVGTKYVDNFKDRTGMAMNETKGWGTNNYDEKSLDHPTAIRNGLFGYGIGYVYSGGAEGSKSNSITFRPVIWNID